MADTKQPSALERAIRADIQARRDCQVPERRRILVWSECPLDDPSDPAWDVYLSACGLGNMAQLP